MDMKRTKYEQETIINLNAEESFAEVYTCDPVWIRKMDSLCKRQPKQFSAQESRTVPSGTESRTRRESISQSRKL